MKANLISKTSAPYWVPGFTVETMKSWRTCLGPGSFHCLICEVEMLLPAWLLNTLSVCCKNTGRMFWLVGEDINI